MENTTEPKNDSGKPDRISNLRKIAAQLVPFGVEFIVIGGQAETLMGSPRVTYDVDLC